LAAKVRPRSLALPFNRPSFITGVRLPVLHPRDRRGQALGDAGAELVLVALHEQAVVLAEQMQGVDRVGEPEPGAANFAGILAAAIEEILNRDLDEGRGLVAGELRPVEHRIAARADAHVVDHVGACEPTQFLQDLLGGHDGALGRLRLQLGQPAEKVSIR
jgi:hypothetical protein